MFEATQNALNQVIFLIFVLILCFTEHQFFHGRETEGMYNLLVNYPWN
jgi:hypothetical protein